MLWIPLQKNTYSKGDSKKIENTRLSEIYSQENSKKNIYALVNGKILTIKLSTEL